MELNDLQQQRLAKLERLRAAGIDPYPPRAERTHTIASVLQAFDALAELRPNILIPGHGSPSDMDTAKRHTRDYLVFLRTAVSAMIDKNASLQEAIDGIDQSAFASLVNFPELARRNAHQAYIELERE